MNKKGFTLVELLAVIIILSLLALLASTSVSKIVKDSKSDLYDTQIELIKSAAEAWGADNLYDLPDASECKYMTLWELKQYGLIDHEIKNPRTNELFPNSLIIKITGKENKFGLSNITYDVDNSDIKDCNFVYPVCSLISGEPNTIGSKYQCKVKYNMEEGFEDGYYFYVLSQEDDGTTNLIMDRNIYYDNAKDVGLVVTEENKGPVAWSSSGASQGPVTAMNYLHNATKDWNNIQNIVINYTDEGARYGTIMTTNNVTKITRKDGTSVTVLTDKEGYTNLKARMPYYSELMEDGKCNWQFGSCPLWLVNHLSPSEYYKTEDGKIDVSGLNGYWTFSTDSVNSNFAYVLEYRGTLLAYNASANITFGVRPVINVRL